MAHIWHMDPSEAGMKIVRQRLAARHLKNVTLLQGKLEDLDHFQNIPDTFDSIDCCGVLHHLKDPVIGLQKLSEKLHPDGGMGLMDGVNGLCAIWSLGSMRWQEMIHQLASPVIFPH